MGLSLSFFLSFFIIFLSPSILYRLLEEVFSHMDRIISETLLKIILMKIDININIIDILFYGLGSNCVEIRTKISFWLIILIGENAEYRKRVQINERYMSLLAFHALGGHSRTNEHIQHSSEMLLTICYDEARKVYGFEKGNPIFGKILLGG